MNSVWTPPFVPARISGWEREFIRIMELSRETPFSWGSSDCLTLPADLAVGMTGVDPMLDLRTYSTEFGAMKVLMRINCVTIEDALKRALQPIPVLTARRGDCGIAEQIVDGKKQQVTLIVMGDRAVGKSASGEVSYPTHLLKSAFAIGAR